MKGIVEHLQAKMREQKYRLSYHAEKERASDRITQQELEDTVLSKSCAIVEDYPDDPRGHSCLILGFTQEALPIHMVCGNLQEEEFLVITVYRPNPNLWTDWRIRKGS